MAVIYVRGDDYDNLLSKLLKAEKLTADMVRETVRDVAYAGRIRATKTIDGHLQMGQTQTKGKKGAMVSRRFSKDGPSGQGYVSTTRQAGQGGSFRLINYSWERAKALNAQGYVKKRFLRSANVSSLMANLWANDTKPYGKGSPWFSRNGGSTGRWQAGSVRKGKNFWSKIVQDFQSGVPQGVARVERKYTSQMEGL